jgi:cytochrome c5
VSEHRSSELGTALAGLVGIVVLVALVYSLTAKQFAGGGDTGTPEQVAARIAPVGTVVLAGGEPPAPAPAAAPAAVDGDPGVAIYNKACAACHASGAAGAPKIGDKAAWEPRLAQGLDQLLQTAIAGKGAMPPRGTCMDCSDDDLKVAIEYMLVQVGYEPAVSADAPDAQEAEGPSATQSMSGMSGMTGMTGMTGMSGTGGISGLGGISGISGEYRTGPDGSIYLYPAQQGVMTGMSGMGGAAEETPDPSAADLPRVKGK